MFVFFVLFRFVFFYFIYCSFTLCLFFCKFLRSPSSSCCYSKIGFNFLKSLAMIFVSRIEICILLLMRGVPIFKGDKKEKERKERKKSKKNTS